VPECPSGLRKTRNQGVSNGFQLVEDRLAPAGQLRVASVMPPSVMNTATYPGYKNERVKAAIQSVYDELKKKPKGLGASRLK
jgi:hypothetical protein